MATATESIRLRRLRGESLGGARVREALWGYGFVLVPMAVFLLFFIYPFAYAIYISFFNWGILGKQSGAGWSNYEAVWNDEIFRRAIRNTLYYTVAVVPLEMRSEERRVGKECRSRWERHEQEGNERAA